MPIPSNILKSKRVKLHLSLPPKTRYIRKKLGLPSFLRALNILFVQWQNIMQMLVHML